MTRSKVRKVRAGDLRARLDEGRSHWLNCNRAWRSCIRIQCSEEDEKHPNEAKTGSRRQHYYNGYVGIVKASGDIQVKASTTANI